MPLLRKRNSLTGINILEIVNLLFHPKTKQDANTKYKCNVQLFKTIIISIKNLYDRKAFSNITFLNCLLQNIQVIQAQTGNSEPHKNMSI